jgi:hypothetical protein
MTWNINLVVEGERPTLLHTDKANEVIKALQALSNISIKKGSRDEVVYSDDEITITYGTSRDGISLTTHGFVSLATVTFQDGLLVNYTL